MAYALKSGCLLFAAALSSLALAEVLPDPTRPPLIGPDGFAAQTGASGVSAGLQLQAVFVRQGQKPRAMINGEWVELGHRFGDARVLKIAPETVILRGPNGRETLVLTPGVTKQPAAGPGRSQK